MIKKTYYLYIYGCQMNLSDAERLAAVLENLGYQRTEEAAQASLVAVVACAVRQKSFDRVIGLIRNLQKMKNKPVTILTGCVLPADQKKLSRDFDYIFGIEEIRNLANLLKQKKTKLSGDYLAVRPLYQSTFKAYVPIMTGCNNFCSYCAVPYTRGRERSRPAAAIVREVRGLIRRGYKQIILVGQNVNSYQGRRGRQIVRFAELLKTIDQLPGDYWLSFVTSHPKDMSDSLIKTMSQSRHLMPYLHLPIQAGDNQILRLMNRKYTVEHYLSLVKKIRRTLPTFALTTDIIVGFPTESKKQFANTLKIFKQADYDMVYLAQFSPRPGTAAARLKDDVDSIEKKRRWNKLNTLLTKNCLKKNRQLVGKLVEVLVEKANSQKDGWLNCGSTNTFKNVSFFAEQDLTGKFVTVKITKAKTFALVGKLENKKPEKKSFPVRT